MAMTTSLSVPPVASLSRLRFSSDVDRIAKRRSGVTDAFHGVGGADVSGNDTRSSDRSLAGSERRAIAPSVERAWSRDPTDTGDPGRIGEIAHHIQ